MAISEGQGIKKLQAEGVTSWCCPVLPNYPIDLSQFTSIRFMFIIEVGNFGLTS
jgi:hypothetical protein